MKKSSFTLIEMLVVIGIIGVLAAMIMPALGGARAASMRTECINNKHQLGLAALQYAGDNNSMIPYKVSGNNYAYVLANKAKDDDKPNYMPEEAVMTCNQNDSRKLDATGSNASGMLNADANWYSGNSTQDSSTTMIKKLGRFRSKKDANNISYSLPKMTNPAGTIIFADTFKQVDAGGGAAAYWSFIPNDADSTAYVATVHGGSAVVAFADGSSKAMNAGELYESALEISKTLDESMSKVQTK